MYSEYQLFAAEATAHGKRMGILGSAASIANRVSYAMNLHGPSMTVDTMCSSSLTAIHVACQDLKLHRTSLAIAGGVNVSIHPNKYLVLSAGQAISSDGHCQSFGEGGDGYIPGEGVGVVVLKRLWEAERDGDHIYGIIRGSALNHGGKTNGYTVPNPQAQASAIGRALAEAGVEARQISYIEAHGTGTKLGDPIEIAALSKAFQQSTQERGYCRIGSAKSNIGHCESAAGIAGLTKVLLQMEHGEIVASLHAERLNPHIDFEGTPFVVNRELVVWERPEVEGREVARMAGVSSFGAGGSNAHMIVEEYRGGEERRRRAGENRPVMIVLSARTVEQLRQKGQDLLEFVERGEERIDLEEMGYTLQVGREGMEERVGMVVSGVEELRKKLELYVGGEQGIEEVYTGQVKNRREGLGAFSGDDELEEAVEKWIEKGKLGKVVEMWVKGLEVDWSRVYGEEKPNKISLPTYPFAKERYWVEARAANTTATAVLHPLLHRNISDFNEQRYSSIFMGSEFFLTDHQVAVNGRGKQKVLPGVAYLEMARAAMEQALPARPESAVLELHHTAWTQPVVVDESKQISIALWATDNEEIEYEIYSGESQEGEEEIVHCQGRAVWSDEAKPGRLDLERLKGEMRRGRLESSTVYATLSRMGVGYGPSLQALTGIDQGNRQVLAQLRLPKEVEETLGEYVLHPSLLEGALQACIGLRKEEGEGWKQERWPFALERMRVVSGCRREMVAWVRYAAGSEEGDQVVRLDVDLCDEHGNVCVQMRGVSWRQGGEEIVEPGIEQTIATSDALPENIFPAPARKEIAWIGHQPAAPMPVQPGKPTGISLLEPSAFVLKEKECSENAAAGARVSIVLADRGVGLSRPGNATHAVSAVRLFDCGRGIFLIQIAASAGQSVGDRIGDLLQALERVGQERVLKVVMVRGLERSFRDSGRGDYKQAVERGLYAALVGFSCPVIAVVEGDARGAGFLAAALCDLMVCSEEGTYGYGDRRAGFYPTAGEMRVLSARFGEALAEELGLGASRGGQLRGRGWTCALAAAEQVEQYAEQLAGRLAEKSQEALHLLKRHLMRELEGWVKALPQEQEAVRWAREERAGAMAGTMVSSTEHIHVDSPAEEVVLLRFCVAGREVGIKELVAELGVILAQVEQSDRYKAMVLASDSPEFVAGTEQEMAQDVVLELKRLMLESRIPIMAALEGNARGPSWLISQFCDRCVYSQTGVYSSAGMGPAPAVAQTAAALFTSRLGDSLGGEMLLTGGEYSGMDLQQRAAGLLAEGRDHVLPAAVGVAQSWAGLAEWKRHKAAMLEEKLVGLPVVVGWERSVEEKAAAGMTVAAGPIPLSSKVVTAMAHAEGIVVVKMEDRQARNMFSEALIEGLKEVFRHIEQRDEYKVVVLSGYDSYFCCGGTKESLLAIQRGEAKFTDFRIFEAALDCRLPVIAALQGHGIGAGWILGLLADVVLLSQESRYESPYMNYGFTPGAGATWIVGKKLGEDVARESLLTGQEYGGRELKERGVRVRTLPRAEVYGAAMEMARQMARSERNRLIGMKRQLNQHLRQVLEETYRLELAMHEKTFVGRCDTLEQIEKNFYKERETVSSSHAEREDSAVGNSPAIPPPEQVEGAKPWAQSDVLAGVTATLRTLLANELQMRESDVEENAQFVDLGLDSISGVTWVRKINQHYHTSIEATKVYSYPMLSQLSRYVKQEAEKQGTLSPGVETVVVEEPAPSAGSRWSDESHKKKVEKIAGKQEDSGKLRSRRNRVGVRLLADPAGRPGWGVRQPIAVIGMAGQFPQARNVEEYWQNLAQGRNCIVRVAEQRWDVNAYYQAGAAVAGKSNSQWLGTLEEYDRFDPLFFNISPSEAQSMDPQQRLFLQACWHSIEDAGYDARGLSGSKCGVFAGCAYGDYHLLSRQQQLSAQGFTGDATSILAARIAYFLNLQGPCISLDTACSSSLVALAHACDSLASGGSDVALAGGVYVMAGPEMHIKASQAGMLSPQGRCYSFDQRADGFVPGEAVGVVLLKRLEDAERDRDLIYGVIEGWGVNQDGKTNGITAPNPESQTRLEQQVYEKYGIDPGSIQLIEAHGTGTKLGDPIEVEGLKKAFGRYTQKREYCALGSVKSNIGHCLAAAGIAGVIKLLLALEHKQLPPTINFERLNEHIELKESPFYVNRRLQEWRLKGAERRRAAISAFGFSGTNAHMVIGEYMGVGRAVRPVIGNRQAREEGKVLIPLSARRPEQLRQRARDLLEFIAKEGTTRIDLAEMGHTLQVGREGMEERLGLVVGSVEEAREKLQAYVDGKQGIQDVYEGQVRGGKESLSLISQDTEVKAMIVEKWMGEKKLSKLMELWVKGLELDWTRLYGEERPGRMRLPVYPFAKERYWIESSSVEAVAGPAAGVLHPLLQRNTSDLSEQRYSSTFTGEEFFLRDHRVGRDGGGTEKVLPGAAYLEMARAAIAQAWPMQPLSAVLELRNIVWAQPIVVIKNRQISIA
jgi:acyl transferase domain-containing protein/enoyl-CoA hydratase/carnithine racemase/acyl carrier protein